MLCVPLLQAAAAADLASLAVEAWRADQRKNQQAAWRCVPVFGPTTGRNWQLQHSSVRQPRCQERQSDPGTDAPIQVHVSAFLIWTCRPLEGLHRLVPLRRRGPADVSRETKVTLFQLRAGSHPTMEVPRSQRM